MVMAMVMAILKISIPILNRCTRQQQTVSALETKKLVPSLTRRIFDSLSFIKDHVLPLETLEMLLIIDKDRITSDTNLYKRIQYDDGCDCDGKWINE